MKIVLATVNARYSHTSFGLRYLKANLHEFEQNCEIMEFSQDLPPQDIAEKIEKNLTYPGQIRVTVIRERRASGFAK